MDKSTLKQHLVALILIITAAIIPYLNTLSNEFVFDDISFIVENDEIQDPWNVIKYLQRPRGIKFIIHVIEYNLSGLNPLPYHVTNIFLHLLCTMSLYILFSMLFPSYKIPLITALLFATHPVHTEAVSAISNRTELLAMFFFLWSFVFYILKHKSKPLYFLSLICFVFALFSKEAAVVMLPVLLVLYDTHFKKANRLALKKNLRYYMPYGIIIISFLLVLRFILLIHPNTADPRVASLFLHSSFPTFIYAALKAFLMYLKLLLLPVNLSVEHMPTLPISFFDWKVAMSLFSVILFIFITLKMNRLSTAISFGMAWFLITLLPLLNLFFPLAPYTVAERYLYLPSAGFCLILGIAIDKIMKFDRSIFISIRHQYAVVFLLIVTLILYTGITMKRNLDWRSNYTLWSKTVIQSPESSRAHIGLGNAYSKMGKYTEAIAHYEQALENVALNKSIKSLVLNDLGNSYLMIGSIDQAIISYENAIRISPGNDKAHYNRGILYKHIGRADKSASQFQEALLTNSDL